MKSRQETILQIVLVVALLLFAAYIGPRILGTDAQSRHGGDPTDVTSLVSKETLLRPDRPERGATVPKYTLVDFGDFECPTCAKAQPVVQDVLRKRSDLRVIYRHFLHTQQHPHAMVASLAAEAAGAQHKFWEMADLLYSTQDQWTEAGNTETALQAMAQTLGLDTQRFTADLHADKDSPSAVHIQQDMQDGQACSVELTPTFFLVTPTHIWAAVGPVGLERLRDDAKYWQ